MSSANNAITIDGDDNGDNTNNNVVDLTDDRKPAAKPSPRLKSATKRNSTDHPFVPFHLYASSTSTQTSPVERTDSTKQYFRTLRQVMGLDSSTLSSQLNVNAKPSKRSFQWLIISNFIIDFGYLLEKTLPDILDFHRVVVFYQEAHNVEAMKSWENMLAGTGNTVEFVRLVPTDPPRSSCNPLSHKFNCEYCDVCCSIFHSNQSIFLILLYTTFSRLMNTVGCHHTKMFLTGYNEEGIDSIRVSVHTANLWRTDIEYKSQGVYSQVFPLKQKTPADDTVNKLKRKQIYNPYEKKKKPAAGSSSRGWPFEDDKSQLFEDDLVGYLESYHYRKQQSWKMNGESMNLLALIRQYDFSEAYAVLIPSVPGYHSLSIDDFGYLKLRKAIIEWVCNQQSNADSRKSSSNAKPPLVCQYSSVGSLTTAWLDLFTAALDSTSTSAVDPVEYYHEVTKKAKSRAKGKKGVDLSERMKIVWPTVDEIRTTIEGYNGGGSVPGRTKNVAQSFLLPLYHRWTKRGNDFIGRTDNVDPLRTARNVPHIKTYVQPSTHVIGDTPSIEWMVLTSHNLSKAAWGNIENRSVDDSKVLFIRHWELGVFISPATLANSKFTGGEARRIVPYIGNDIGNSPINLADSDDGGDTESRDVVAPLPYDVMNPSIYHHQGEDMAWTVDGPWSRNGFVLPDLHGVVLR
eukprot:scaffold5469_cov175-Alexandrium_tamarense.AAC.7